MFQVRAAEMRFLPRGKRELPVAIIVHIFLADPPHTYFPLPPFDR
jgi:hypothetical protein